MKTLKKAHDIKSANDPKKIFVTSLCSFLITIVAVLSVYKIGYASGQYPAIINTSSPNGWLIRTKSSAYRIIITKSKKIYPIYYGPLVMADDVQPISLWRQRVEEIPTRGGTANKTNILEVTYQNHEQNTNLEYVSGRIIKINGRPTLKIVEKDKWHALQVTSYIRVLKEYNILEKWIEVKNTGNKGNIKIQNLLSGSILLPTDRYVLTQLSGHELGEFHPYTSDVTPGLKVIENRTFKSNNNMPWFLVRPKRSENDPRGPTWWGCIHYSGNWKIVLDDAYDRRDNYTLQIAAGINFWNTAWTLHPGETFTAPVFSVGYTNDGAEGAARDNAAYVRNAVLPEAHRYQLRPVIFNGWMTTVFNVNDSIELRLAKAASKLGVELFVIDDGWYKGRTNSSSGLGDWMVDKKKFPNGLGPLIDSVHKMGMKFGLWIEPESIVTNSDIYRKHPDWVLGPEHGPKPTRMFLNLAREDVFQHLFQVLDKLLTDNKIDYIKWDQNTYLNENVYWSEATPDLRREMRIRFIHNLYRLVDTLRQLHPHTLFESCASGGGRVDLGMLSRMDWVWPSDNSMATDRLFIQYGYLSAMPANTMESWVLGNWNYQQNNQPSLSFKFDVAMSGLLGISDNILQWTSEERAMARKKIAVYKQIRSVIQRGTLYRLISPFNHNRCALQYNSQNADSIVVFCYNLAQYVTASYMNNSLLEGGGQFLDAGSTTLKLQGLNPNRKYRITVAGNEKNLGQIYSGEYLMRVGMIWPLKKPFDSRIFLLKQTGE